MATYKIVSQFNGKVLDVPGFATGPSPIQQFQDNGGPNQHWKLVSVANAFFKIVSQSSGLVLDVPGFATGPSPIQQFPDNGGANQLWQLILVNEDGITYKIVSWSSVVVLYI